MRRAIGSCVIVIVLILIWMSSACLEEPKVDPSLVQLLGRDGEPATRVRVFGDFNLDGIPDMAVSESLESVSQT